MQFVTNRLLNNFYSFFNSDSTTQSFAESESQSLQLSKMIQHQKRINNLVYICEQDSDGRIICKWVKACSL